MRLTVYTDFSLRVLMFLALRGNGLATIAEIAKAYGISKNHLMKVAHQLGLAGTLKRSAARAAACASRDCRKTSCSAK